MVDKEFIEIYRNMLKPSISSWLLKTNYEGMGEQDKEEFERDFDEILDLALIGLKYKTQPSPEGTTKGTTSDIISRQAVKYLDLFTKTYCRDESATDDLVFRCSDCEFELRPSGKCLVKCMARKLCPDYKDFGSMGDL